jgi:signal transduction histidine kinase
MLPGVSEVFDMEEAHPAGLPPSLLKQLRRNSMLDFVFFTFLSLHETCLNKQLLNRLKMERQQINVFLGKMSHELRTPLVGIRSAWDLIQEYLPSEEEEPSIRDIRNMVESCFNGILGQIDNILDERKFQRGRLVLRPVEVNLKQLISSCVDMVRAKIIQKSLNIELELKSNLPELVMADKTKLAKILINLLSNAIKFSERGTIRVTASCAQEELKPSQFRFREIFLFFFCSSLSLTDV